VLSDALLRLDSISGRYPCTFRAGIEGIISFLKRSFGWDRCAWRSYGSFRAYTWGSVIAANLVMLARHSLG
jgi:IS5 family transposase